MTLKENWVSVEGYEGLYEVSNFGGIRRIESLVTQKGGFTGKNFTRVYKKRLLKPRLPKNGYPYVSLSKNGKRVTYTVHRIVALHFLDNPNNYPEVNHKDGDKSNNAVENLEWCTSSENKKHCFDIGLRVNEFGVKAHNFKGVVEVYKNGIVIDTLQGDLDIRNKGYTSCGVSAVLTGRQKTHRGCTFKRIKKEER